MKKMTAQTLLLERGIVVEVPDVSVKGFKDGFNTINSDSFVANKVTLIRLNTFTKNSTQIFYFDEKNKAERAIVVPNEFLFKAADAETTKDLMAKYKEWMLSNLWQHVGYLGTSIGSDPEIFVEDEKGNVIPAFSFLPAKNGPNRPYNTGYWDGFQAEFDTTANSCMQVHSSSIREGLKSIHAKLKAFNKNAKLSAKTVFDIPLELLKTSAKEHVAFGCRSSLNAYGLKGIEAPGEEVTYRSAGGHIHFGLGNDKIRNDKEGIAKMVKALDAVLGVACVSMCGKYDDPRRRQMYGLAGEYRLPPHGFEYRTLSNAWMFHPLIAHLTFDLARSTTTFGYKDFLHYWECDEKETIRIINECDITAARAVLKRNKKILLQIINSRYADMERAEFVYDILYMGMDSVLKSPTDIESNWGLVNPAGFNNSPVFSYAKATTKV
jgi:hypothetical protein